MQRGPSATIQAQMRTQQSPSFLQKEDTSPFFHIDTHTIHHIMKECPSLDPLRHSHTPLLCTDDLWDCPGPSNAIRRSAGLFDHIWLESNSTTPSPSHRTPPPSYRTPSPSNRTPSPRLTAYSISWLCLSLRLCSPTLAKSLLLTQWAAVSTQRGCTNTPPQNASYRTLFRIKKNIEILGNILNRYLEFNKGK